MEEYTSAFIKVPIKKVSVDVYEVEAMSILSTSTIQSSSSEMSKLPQNTRRTKPEELCLAKRASTDRDSAQQGFLLGILMCYDFTIKIRRLYKKGHKTHQLFVIESISKNGTVYFKAPTTDNKSGDKKLMRRNLDAMTNNSLLNIVQYECATKLDLKRGKRSNLCTEMKRIQAIQFHNDLFKAQDILRHGLFINESILNKMTPEGCELTSNDKPYLTSCLY
ncbi:hypothetical protein EIN_096170 [Entamoeba invadens IP1]|uniref:Uncharacterized protein n=1 Tax=Entamoeba invadens IP1 TaxID=370355 RepID=A0A0A1U0E5_ENTIV|nr:hypothetical protein EIN_096170 [Entamoeba invadens IP1]ELP87360.1 hypothetical protein EIN_096170 [Entamoeba invadens IP1]|eukprot:XP_004254131.1 hypothetical protein EIN_096170 [Entamoeba invadens IP1]